HQARRRIAGRPRVPAAMMRADIMVPGSAGPAPQATVAMRSLLVIRLGQAFGDHAPLHGQVGGLVDGKSLVDTPAGGAVVDNDVAPFGAETILLLPRFIARAKPQVADDNVVGLHV